MDCSVSTSESSSDEDSFDEEGASTFHEWKAFVVKTYYGSKDPVRKIYEVKGQENNPHQSRPIPLPQSKPQASLRPPPLPPPPPQLQPPPLSQSRPQSAPTYPPSQRTAQKHSLTQNKFDRTNFKAKLAKKANQPLPQNCRLISSPLNTQKADNRFKIPDRDAAGNPINFQTTSNPYARSISTANSTSTISTPSTTNNNNNNTSMTSNHHFCSVTSSLNKISGQMSSSMPQPPTTTSSTSSSSSSIPSSSRVTKGSNYPESNITPIAKVTPAAHLKTRSDVFWSLNSAAKLLHVKSQLDEPSKIYLDKLVKNNGIVQREILKLRKDKQDLLNTIKMIEKVISDPTGVHHQS